MPFKSAKIKLNETQDRRRKLSTEQRERIKSIYSTGLISMNGLAKKFGVSKTTVLLIVNEASHERVQNYNKSHWRNYYDTEENTKAIREHRRYKQSLYIKGELKEEKTKEKNNAEIHR